MSKTRKAEQVAGVTGPGGGVGGGGRGGVRGLRGLSSVVRPYAGRLVWAMAAGVAAELCGLGLVAAAAWLIARAAQQPTMAALSVAIVAVRGFALGKGALRYLERLAGHDVALRALAQLRGRVFDALAARGRGPRDLRDGEALSGLVSDVEAVQDLLLRCVLPAVTAVVCGAVGVAVCAVAVPVTAVPLTAGLLVAGVVLPWAAWTAGARAAARVVRQRRRLAVCALDVLDGAEDLAVFGAAERFHARAVEAARRLEQAERAASRIAGVVGAAGSAVQGATAAVVAWQAVRSGADQVQVAVVALTALVAVEAVMPLAGAAQRMRDVLASARRMAALLASPPPAQSRGGAAVPAGPLSVELLGVTVAFDAAVSPAHGRAAWDGVALDRVDVRVERGRRVAIVGASGAGKSTLLAAVAGAVTPLAGSVQLAGRDLAAYAEDDVRAAVRGLTQDAHVFAGSVRANLLLARPDASQRQLEAAARRARFLEVVRELPEGWDTVVGEGGRALSGGQRQRLLLARALLADPPVLVLDEPTEALDTATADEITRELLTWPGGGTLLLVTHRLAALGDADEVLVVDRGRVVQRGRHDDLVARPGAYRDLWEAERLSA
ncbi:thiol reductant ABC exporter subunit CydC [Actinomadura sp. NBRC 104425]|uniref:thiol reductant ABC exporter subunit CydC n=1 Tax=Actinomadura sp. NBRC 104425 TaxID=3032204 RepID=UPI0025536AA0|nr:thiol reductant ABC exporter subunit CydC [Actinomadura sp. NBRC 104425]